MRDEGEGFEFDGVGRCSGGGEIEERIIGGEVVPVINAGYVVEVGVLNEGVVVSR